MLSLLDLILLSVVSIVILSESLQNNCNVNLVCYIFILPGNQPLE